MSIKPHSFSVLGALLSFFSCLLFSTPGYFILFSSPLSSFFFCSSLTVVTPLHLLFLRRLLVFLVSILSSPSLHSHDQIFLLVLPRLLMVPLRCILSLLYTSIPPFLLVVFLPFFHSLRSSLSLASLSCFPFFYSRFSAFFIFAVTTSYDCPSLHSLS